MTGNVETLTGSWRSRARYLADTLSNLIFPPFCANCKKVGKLLCADCIDQMDWLYEPLCDACGRMLDRPASRCYVCARKPLPLQQVRTAVYFVEPVQAPIHKLKYENAFGLARPLADLMVRAWPQWQKPIDLVIPIPLHSQRQKKRGYNQAELLAVHLCGRLKLTHETTILARSRYTRSQVGLNLVDRLANVTGAFSVMGSDIAGKNILLIDDVFTTGATMSAACEVLLAAQVATVSGYCLARTKRY